VWAVANVQEKDKTKKEKKEKANKLRAAVDGKAKEAQTLSDKATKAAAAERTIAMTADVVNLEVGHNMNRQGAAFEMACLNAVAERYDLLDEDGQVLLGEDVRVLQNVRLGRTNEVDLMVVRVLDDTHTPGGVVSPVQVR
jgi:hypothetical protein